MPLSSFAKAAGHSSSSKKQPKNKLTSSFSSTVPQRPRPRNEMVPGPGGYDPSMAAMEKETHTPNFRGVTTRTDLGWSATEDVGPGAYNTHKYQTLAADSAHALLFFTKQNPGFGIGSPQHQLPHEQKAADDAELPWPGKYETNKSELSTASGHGSSFKPPTSRKIQNLPGEDTRGPPGSRRKPPTPGGGKRGGKKAGADGTLHV